MISMSGEQDWREVARGIPVWAGATVAYDAQAEARRLRDEAHERVRVAVAEYEPEAP